VRNILLGVVVLTAIAAGLIVGRGRVNAEGVTRPADPQGQTAQ
jgi:hypothetical protein